MTNSNGTSQLVRWVIGGSFTFTIIVTGLCVGMIGDLEAKKSDKEVCRIRTENTNEKIDESERNIMARIDRHESRQDQQMKNLNAKIEKLLERSKND